MRRAIWVGVLMGMVVVGGGRVGAAGQQSGVPLPGPPFPDSTADPRSSRRGEDPSDTEERRQMEAKRAGAANAERQKVIVADANLILRTAAEVQLTLAKDDNGAARQDAMRQLDNIAKLAHTVRDTMKYTR